jgi:hypothetical protein
MVGGDAVGFDPPFPLASALFRAGCEGFLSKRSFLLLLWFIGGSLLLHLFEQPLDSFDLAFFPPMPAGRESEPTGMRTR